MPPESIQWPPEREHIALTESDVHIRAASLAVSPDAEAAFATTLSPAEKERADRFKFERHRRRFIAGRGLLRVILGKYLQVEPAELDFVYSAQSKPSLAPPFAAAGIQFNLAHSDDLALFAVTRAETIGVDVELIRPLKDAGDLVARFFSKRENESYQQLPADQKPAAFFNLWTRKEALLKATGEGIMGGLNRVEVSFLPREPARLLAIAGDTEKAKGWELWNLTPAPGFAAAAAVPKLNLSVKCWKLAERQ